MATHAARMRKLYPYLAPSTTADHIVIGGGAIGLAVAAGLANTAGKNRTTFLVERNSLVSNVEILWRWELTEGRSSWARKRRETLELGSDHS